MKVTSFNMDYALVDGIIHHLKLVFVADKPPPSSHLAGTYDGFRNRHRIFFTIPFFTQKERSA